MALISCPDCGKQVSTSAAACPHCGYPVPKQGNAEQRPDPAVDGPVNSGAPNLLLKVRSSFWNFSWQVVVLLIALPLGIVYLPGDWWRYAWVVPVAWVVYILISTFYHRKSFVMRIYPDRVSVVEGFLAKETSEFLIRDIRAIDVKQSLWARLVNIGDLTISTAASTEGAEEAPGVPGPNRIRDLLISLRQRTSAD